MQLTHRCTSRRVLRCLKFSERPQGLSRSPEHRRSPISLAAPHAPPPSCDKWLLQLGRTLRSGGMATPPREKWTVERSVGLTTTILSKGMWSTPLKRSGEVVCFVSQALSCFGCLICWLCDVQVTPLHCSTRQKRRSTTLGTRRFNLARRFCGSTPTCKTVTWTVRR